LDQEEWRAVARLLSAKKDKFPTLRDFTDDELNELFHTVSHGKATIRFDDFLSFFRTGVDEVSPRPTTQQAPEQQQEELQVPPLSLKPIDQHANGHATVPSDHSSTVSKTDASPRSARASSPRTPRTTPRSVLTPRSKQQREEEERRQKEEKGRTENDEVVEEMILARTVSTIVREHVTSQFEDREVCELFSVACLLC
jgi:hypothetical protein